MDAEADGSVAGSESEDSGKKHRVHGMLKMYYGMNEEGKTAEMAKSLDPCDINGPHFDHEVFLNKVNTAVKCFQCDTTPLMASAATGATNVLSILVVTVEWHKLSYK